jgi:hypothetical protein
LCSKKAFATADASYQNSVSSKCFFPLASHKSRIVNDLSKPILSLYNKGMNTVENHPTEGFEVSKFAAGFIQRQAIAYLTASFIGYKLPEIKAVVCSENGLIIPGRSGMNPCASKDTRLIWL